MKVSYGEGVANHAVLESCVAYREVRDEALTEVRTGQPLSRESPRLPGRRRCPHGGRQHAGARQASARAARRGQRPWHVQKLLVREPGDLWIGRREAVRIGKALSRSR